MTLVLKIRGKFGLEDLLGINSLCKSGKTLSGQHEERLPLSLIQIGNTHLVAALDLGRSIF